MADRKEEARNPRGTTPLPKSAQGSNPSYSQAPPSSSQPSQSSQSQRPVSSLPPPQNRPPSAMVPSNPSLPLQTARGSGPPPASSSGAAYSSSAASAGSARPQSAMPQRSSNEPDRVAPSKPVDLPLEGTLTFAMQLALKKDKPIILSFWIDSLTKKISYLYDETEKETILFKSPEEYTSPIIQKYNNKTDVICETENSLYIIRAGLDTKSQQ